jgi:hypothetical protein
VSHPTVGGMGGIYYNRVRIQKSFSPISIPGKIRDENQGKGTFDVLYHLNSFLMALNDRPYEEG